MKDLDLIAVDLDGTLLDDKKRLSPRNRFALERLLTQGVIVVLASARDCASIRLKVPIQLPGLYYIGSGGGLIYEAATQEVIWTGALSPELIVRATLFLRKFGHPVFLNSKDDYWVDRYNDRVKMIEDRYNLQTTRFTDPLAIGYGLMRVSLAAPIPVLEQATAQAKTLFGDEIQVSLASQDWLDLLPSNAGKGRLLAILQEELGVTQERTMAIGDYESDLSLFEHARYRVAMGNAVAAVKAASTTITGTNNDDGVAQAVEPFLQ